MSSRGVCFFFKDLYLNEKCNYLKQQYTNCLNKYPKFKESYERVPAHVEIKREWLKNQKFKENCFPIYSKYKKLCTSDLN